MNSNQRPSRPPSEPVALVPVDRSHRAVLENLGQLFRHDLSEAYGLLPNADGTFNNQRLDLFRTESTRRAWLITVAEGLGGFVMTCPTEDGGTSITDFFVVRALRRTGVGREAARLLLAQFPGRWHIAFQRTTLEWRTSGRRWRRTPPATRGACTTTRLSRGGHPTPGSRSQSDPAARLSSR